MKWMALIPMTVAVLLAGSGSGIQPRASNSDYAAHASAGEATIGASLVPAKQVRKLVGADLGRAGYLVVEVGIYPASGRQLRLIQDDFMLHGGSSMIRTASADTVAAMFNRGNAPAPPQISSVSPPAEVSTTAGIGRGTAPDPITGQRQNGPYTTRGAGVGTEPADASSGSPSPGPADGPMIPDNSAPPRPPAPAPERIDPAVVQQQLADKALPEGDIVEPVAGYLYFPRPPKMKKNEPLELTWYTPQGNVRLSLPPPGK